LLLALQDEDGDDDDDFNPDDFPAADNDDANHVDLRVSKRELRELRQVSGY
jgi:hypothetical protein